MCLPGVTPPTTAPSRNTEANCSVQAVGLSSHLRDATTGSYGLASRPRLARARDLCVSLELDSAKAKQDQSGACGFAFAVRANHLDTHDPGSM